MDKARLQQGKTENEKKKEYLWEYRASIGRINRIESELAEVRCMRGSISVNYDGMPHGTDKGDLSDQIAELDQLERELIEERYTRIVLYKDISKRIKHLKSKKENDVLFYRYIKGLDWWEIAEKMGYSERHVTRLHGKGLAHFEIPKDVLECPR